MHQSAVASWCVVLGLLSPLTAFADGEGVAGVTDPAQARIDYMLHCQGCHGPDGAGTTDGVVPRLNGWLSRFLHIPGGREFLIQVPGSANAAISPERLAEVINWMLVSFGPVHLPRDFVAYSAEEISGLRAKPLTDVKVVREKLMDALEAANLDAPGSVMGTLDQARVVRCCQTRIVG